MRIFGLLVGAALILASIVIAVGSWFALGLPRDGSEIGACVMLMFICAAIAFTGYSIIKVCRE